MFVLAETGAFAVHAVFARETHPVPAVWTAEARLTKAASVDVVAACAVSTVAHAFAVLAVGACSALLVAPEDSNESVNMHTNHKTESKTSILYCGYAVSAIFFVF